MTCSDCSGPISIYSKTGRCRPCSARRNALDPEIKARRIAAFRARLANDPAFREKRAREIHIRHRAARRDPVRGARMNAITRENQKLSQSPEARKKWLAGRAEAGRKRHETVMAWCPVEHRELYRHLRVSKKFRAHEAKQIILGMLTPFERQMHAIKNGARVVAKPDLRDKRDYDFTLGGVTGPLG